MLAFLRADRAEQAQQTADIYHEHEKRISDIKIGHAEVVAEMEKRYAKNIEFLKGELKKARRLAAAFGILFTAETIGIIILFFVDTMNHHIGWLRGLFPFLGDGVSESLRS